MTIIQGLHHRILSEDEVHWTITRGQFEMARITGTIEDAREELAKWDATVLPTKHGTSAEGASPPTPTNPNQGAPPMPEHLSAIARDFWLTP